MLMGWSQGQLADRLSCESQLVSQWESGQILPQNEFVQHLDFLEKEVQMQAEQVLSDSLAEKILEEKDLDQVDTHDIYRLQPDIPSSETH